MNKIEQKNLGAFYTPYKAAKILSDWAINSPNDKVLEPSFGACGFLEACRDTFLNLNVSNPMNQIYGYDIDKLAFQQYLTTKFNLEGNFNRFINKNFLESSPSDFDTSLFNIVIGNPPYISYHNQNKDQRNLSKEIIKYFKIKKKGKFSLWLPFVLQSLKFLKKGGRLAFVLPNSLLEAEYSKEFLAFLDNNFEDLIAIQLGQRLFTEEGTDEVSVILLCKGYQLAKNKKTGSITYANSLELLKKIIFKWNNGNFTGSNIKMFKTPFLQNNTINKLYNSLAHNLVTSLGDIANVKIGLVTGANKFFVVNESFLKKHSLQEDAIFPILSNKRMAEGNKFTMNSLNLASDKDYRCYLISTHNVKEVKANLLSYLDSLTEEFIRNNKTFCKRDPWHFIRTEEVPDAFFTYMNNQGPILIINRTNASCTNTIHRIFFKEKTPIYLQKFYSIALQTSFSQLSSEINGKSYGSGVLKLEPSQVKRITLFKPSSYIDKKEISHTFKKIGNHLINHRFDLATDIADSFCGEYYQKKYLYEFKEALKKIRSMRRDKKGSL